MPFSDEVSTSLVRRFACGEPEAIARMVQCHYDAMIQIAHELIRRHHVDKAVLDRDDAVNVTLFKLWRAARTNRIPALETMDDFWRYFRLSLERNVIHARNRSARQKRGGPGVSARECDPTAPTFDVERYGSRRSVCRLWTCTETLCSDLPAPDALTVADDEIVRLLNLLGDPLLQSVARLRADDYGTREIAKRLGLTTRSIRRKLTAIREIWSAQASRDAPQLA